MLLWDVIPLQFCVESVSECVSELGQICHHVFDNGFLALFLVLPHRTSSNTTKACCGYDNAFLMLLKQFPVDARLAIEVVSRVRLGNHLIDILKSFLVLCEKNDVTLTR